MSKPTASQGKPPPSHRPGGTAAAPTLLFEHAAVRFTVILTAMQFAPVTIKRLGKESVEIVWKDGHTSVYPNRYLRDHCPCASCHERPAHSLPVVGSAELYPEQIGVVGRYAINVQWSDRHNSGIYSYATLRQLCPCESCHTGVDAPTTA